MAGKTRAVYNNVKKRSYLVQRKQEGLAGLVSVSGEQSGWGQGKGNVKK